MITNKEKPTLQSGDTLVDLHKMVHDFSKGALPFAGCARAWTAVRPVNTGF